MASNNTGPDEVVTGNTGIEYSSNLTDPRLRILIVTPKQ